MKKGLPLRLLPAALLAMFHFPALSFELTQRAEPGYLTYSWPFNYDNDIAGRRRALHAHLSTVSYGGCSGDFGSAYTCGSIPLPDCLSWEMILTSAEGVVTATPPYNAATSYDTLVYNSRVHADIVITSQCAVNHLIYLRSTQSVYQPGGLLIGSLAHPTLTVNVPAGVSCTLSGPDVVLLGEFSVEQIQSGVTSDHSIDLHGQCNMPSIRPVVTVSGMVRNDSFKLGEDMKMLLTDPASGGVVTNGVPFTVDGDVNLSAHLSPDSPDGRVTPGDKSASLQVTLSLP